MQKTVSVSSAKIRCLHVQMYAYFQFIQLMFLQENDFDDDEDVEWSEDVFADAVKKRQEELAAGVKALNYSKQ